MKNNLKAIEWRVEGNENYKLSRFYDALVCYNRSLCNSIAMSIEFALSLANRSAVYFEIKDFKLCLENIKLAIDNGYPEDKMTLLDRREKCLQVPSITTCDSPWDFFKLSHPPNENLPFVSKCIELRVSKMFGRHLVTRKALKTGDIICIEEPFHKFINNECRFSHCANCLNSEKFNLIPCGGCNYVMCCSEICMTIANRFHNFECQHVDIDPDIENIIYEVPHRVVFEALGVFGRIEKLQKFCEENSKMKTPFDFDLSDAKDPQREHKMLQMMSSLQRNSIPEDMKPVMNRHVKLMQSITSNAKHQKFLGNFMRKQMEIIITNSFGLTSIYDGDIGSGIFALASFFNHSCAPNITRITVENKLVFVASRPIEKGQQLFVSYRSKFMATPKPERQLELQNSYRFKCSCEACTKNYPTLYSLPSTDGSFSEPSQAIASAESAKIEFQANCKYINERIESFPNFEICTLMNRNRSLLESLAGIASVSR